MVNVPGTGSLKNNFFLYFIYSFGYLIPYFCWVAGDLSVLSHHPCPAGGGGGLGTVLAHLCSHSKDD